MIEVLHYLNERTDEFATHLSVANLLQRQLDKVVDDDDTQVEVRHINTIKSGLLVHLYNIVEATSTRTLGVVSDAVVSAPPGQWTEKVLKEWVRVRILNTEDSNSDKALNTLTSISASLASGQKTEPFKVKNIPGSWNLESIKLIAKRLNCVLKVDDVVAKKAHTPTYRDETNAFRFLADRRNAIAHGNTTFEEGAKEYTLDQIKDLADSILPYLEAVIHSYQTYLNNNEFLKNKVDAA